MKLVRYGQPGQEKPALLDAAGKLRDLSGLLEDFTPKALSPKALDVLRAIDAERLPEVAGTPRLGVPWSGMGKFVAIGLNYSDHAAEAGHATPQEPTMFNKWLSCVCGPNDDTIMPAESTKLDWEVELGIVIGSQARNVTVEKALDHVAGYCLVNDISERSFQIDRSGGQWSKGKGFDTFGPVGPWLVTRDEIADPQCLDMWLNVNGQRRQTGNTSKMIFPCDVIVSYCSRVMTLEPGDLIITGTPPGVGLGCKPPQFLKVGDVVELGVSGLGQQRQVIVASR